MSSSIWKFEVRLTSRSVVKMPIGAKILKCDMQNGSICVWALVNTSNDMVNREFEVYGTGHPVYDGIEEHYLNTVIDGDYVWHVFDFGELYG